MNDELSSAPDITASTTGDVRRSTSYAADKAKLLTRMRRLEGQVRGVAQMIDEDRYCLDVLTQISAAQAALDKIASACSTTTPATACSATAAARASPTRKPMRSWRRSGACSPARPTLQTGRVEPGGHFRGSERSEVR